MLTYRDLVRAILAVAARVPGHVERPTSATVERIGPDRRSVDEEEAGMRHVDQTLISWLIIVALWLCV